MLRDPVCGQRVQRGRAHVRVQHEGYTFYLCCPRCQAEFEANPSLYARTAWGEKTSKPANGTAAIKAPKGSLSYR